MINSNIYEDHPYLPDRDSREINAVNRLKELQRKQHVFVNDEDIQYTEAKKLADAVIKEESTPGKPGCIVRLDNNCQIPKEYIPASSGGSTVISARTHLEFPTVGSEDALYVATEENNGKGYLYRWCEGLNCYEKPYDDLGSVSEICGGDAEIV